MPNISNEITAFQNAVYGKDVQQAIVDLANKLNDDLDDALTHELSTVDATLTQSGAGADAKVVGDKFGEVRTGLSELVTEASRIDGRVTSLWSQESADYTELDGRLDTVEATLPTLATKAELDAKLDASDVDSALSGTSTNPVQNKVVKTAIDAKGADITALGGRLDAVEAAMPTKLSDLQDDKGVLVVGPDLEIQTLNIGDTSISGSFYYWATLFSTSSELDAFWSALVAEQGNIWFLKRGGAKLPLVYDADNEIFYFNARTDHSRVDSRQSYVHIQKTGARTVTFYFDEDRSDDTLTFVASKVRYLTENDGVAKTADLADVATSGDYTDLANTPTIPSKTSELTNNSGFMNETIAEYKGFLRNKTVEETETIGNAALESLGQLTDADGYPVFYGWYATSSTRTWPAALWSALVSASSDGTVYYEDSNGDLKPLTYDSANSRFSYNLNSPTAGLPAANELHRSVSNEPGILIYYLPDNGETDEMHIFLTDNRGDQRIYFFGKTTYEDNYMKERIVDRVTGTVYKIVVRNGQITLDAV